MFIELNMYFTKNLIIIPVYSIKGKVGNVKNGLKAGLK
jgi:hypothetical protein